MKPSRIAQWLAAATLLAACGKAPPAPDPAPPAAGPQGPPTAAEAATATYRGIEEAGMDVTLEDGQWEGRPAAGAVSRRAVGLVRDLLLQDDLDGDGEAESVLLLWSGSGGPGTRIHVAMLDRHDDQVSNVATRLLGDRVQVRKMVLDGGLIRMDVVRAGPGDAACCPGELASLAWGLGDGSLEDREEPRVTGRLGLSALEGSTWRLDHLAWSEEAPATPEVTLAYADGRLAGHAGCNDYGAEARDDGDVPGSVRISPPIATRKMCPPAGMQVEDRFLGQLGSVNRIGFMNGRLMLTHDGGEMLFEPVSPP